MSWIVRLFKWLGVSTNLNSVSQMCHFLISYAVIVTTAYFTHGIWPLVIVNGVVIVFACLKEFWFDPRYETREVAGSDLVDFSFYMVGLLVSNLLIFIS
jgi:hypothetical protein